MITIQLPTNPQPPENTSTPCKDLTNDHCKSEERPCEKYLQFMDSSRQERTFMIEKLIETFANVIDSIWHPKFFENQAKVVPTRGFINEILKRSKATYSTVQISLFYIFRVKKAVHYKLYQRSQKKDNMPMGTLDDLMCCGRRMFLASLMLASKYLHDKNYQNKAWAQITGLKLEEINAAEMAFLSLIDYRLYVSKPTFDKWYTQLHGHIQKGYSQKQKNETLTTEVNTMSLSKGIQQQQSTLVLLSPPSQGHGSFQRTDSGISIMSPPLQKDEELVSKKRQWNHDEDYFQSKRVCQ
jgi:DNA-directed RNA polymerase subunit N (RpoN/RPB10)